MSVVEKLFLDDLIFSDTQAFFVINHIKLLSPGKKYFL